LIIHQPEISKENGEIKISARIEPQQALSNFPEYLWYSFPEKWTPFLTGRSDSFALSLLLFSMLFKEDLEVRGTMSARLAYGLQEYQNVYNAWFPKRFSKIQVKYEHLQTTPSRPTAITPGVGAPFSGGVDSSFTLWSHLPQNTPFPDAELTHLFFVYGFNVHYSEKERLKFFTNKYSAIAKELGLDFVSATTNTRDFLPWIRWIYYGMAGRIGVPLALGHLFKRIYQPSGIPLSLLVPNAASPLLNHQTSTEDTTIIHHGVSLSRGEKLRLMKDWEIVENNLRICDNPRIPEGILNCSRCSKCIRTRVVLDMNGQLAKFKTLKSPITLKSFFRWGLESMPSDEGLFATQQYALEEKHYKYVLLLWMVKLISLTKTFTSAILPDTIRTEVKKLFYPQRKT